MQTHCVFFLADEHDQLHTSVVENGAALKQVVNQLPQYVLLISLWEDPHNFDWDICSRNGKKEKKHLHIYSLLKWLVYSPLCYCPSFFPSTIIWMCRAPTCWPRNLGDCKVRKELLWVHGGRFHGAVADGIQFEEVTMNHIQLSF